MAVKHPTPAHGPEEAPHYRVVVADSAAPRDGRFVESIGYYKPLTEPGPPGGRPGPGGLLARAGRDLPPTP
jgi:hypothetical protein